MNSDDVRAAAAFLKARLTEASTWAGIAAGSAGFAIQYPQLKEQATAVGVVATALAFLLREGKR